jgi:hypothetical protein
MHILENCDKNGPPTSIAVGNVLRAGCDSPPAVMARNASSPRALGWASLLRQGQQTRCDPEADGHSPDEERTGLAPQNRVESTATGVFCLLGFRLKLASPSIQSALFFY